MSFDPAPWRADTEAVAAGRIHLNNAGASLMPRPVHETIVQHLQREVSLGGYEAADLAREAIGQAHADVGALIGAAARNIAVVENATVAFSQALSAFDFQPGDVIVTSRNDYSSNQLMYLSLAQRRGVRVLRAADLPAGGVDPDSVARLVRSERPRLVAITHVPTNSGLVQRVEDIGRICAREDVPYLVDACQSVGQLPLDVERLQCTYLAATARKFLRGPRGVGFLYVSDAALAAGQYPLYIDLHGAHWAEPDRFELVRDATRFENWEFAYALMLGMGTAAAYAQRVGVEAAGRHASQLARHAREQLAAIPGVRVLDAGEELCAIVTVEIDGHDAHDVVRELRDEAINTSALDRSSAVLDMDDKQARSALRVSPHYYNTAREIDIVVGAIEAIASG
ncbi:MAG TPA: aminotransferase class V-fold PLP-dependent enzyme [Longimicrobiales bacterium]|nr:aminotransferase class V-fold PLP-dependent enzyme [Longimicrobiales bacterium]